jgi:hypothetical protein
MVLGDHIVSALDIGDQDVPILDLDAELLLQRLMHLDGSIDISSASLVTPVGIEGNGDALREAIITFQRSGSNWLSLWWTHLMMRLAVRPG